MLLVACLALASAQESIAQRFSAGYRASEYETRRQELIREFESELKLWKPGPDYWARPPAAQIVKGIPLQGTWKTIFHRLDFAPTIEYGKYELTYQTEYWDCVGVSPNLILHRTATLKDGVVTLDRPIGDNVKGGAYQHLYMLKAGTRFELLPADQVLYCFPTKGTPGPVGWPGRGFVFENTWRPDLYGGW